MKQNLLSIALLAFVLSANAQYQVENSGFENWEDVAYNSTNTGQEPLSWNSFLTGTGTTFFLGQAARNQLAKDTAVRPGSTGTYSAKINARKVFGSIIAQGNMTTGCINMGSMTATDAKGNYNYTRIDVDGQNQPFTGKPDAMHVWVKFYSPSTTNNAKVNTILHTAGYYQDPEANELVGKLVAKAVNESITTSDSWQELTIPFTYNSEVTDRPAYALVSFATNNVAGKGSESDVMNIDDLSYLYYSELATLSYNGTSIFEAGTKAYNLSTIVYDESKLAATSNGVAATIEKSFDSSTGILTITVKGDNYVADNTNFHTYTIQFKAPVITNYTNTLTVCVNNQTTAPQNTTIQLVNELDGSYSFLLKNFMLGTGESAIPVGNIKLTNLEKNGNSYNKQQTITITAGDIPTIPVESWFGPNIGPIPVDLAATVDGTNLTANIDINLQDILGQIINVVFAPSLTIDGTTAISSKGLYNVTLSRPLSAGWNMICLPFSYNVAEFGEGAKAEEFKSSTQQNINFTSVENMEAHTPYLLYLASTPTDPIYFGKALTASEPISVTHDLTTFSGVYSNTSLDGKFVLDENANPIKKGAADVAPISGAYITTTSPSLIINLDGVPTGVEGITVDTESTFDVYNMLGIKVLSNTKSLNGLEKGIYIVNGKKLMIK